MNKTWLLLDCQYLCYRAFHTTGELTFNEVKTGVIYGFLRDIRGFQELHRTTNIVFCFDSRQSERRKAYPPYKLKRKKLVEAMSEEDKELRLEMHKQVVKLRREYLPALGYRNILFQKGYEADDMIGSVVFNTLPDTGDQGIIIGSDRDLYQLLGPLVSMWNPIKSKMTTFQSFYKDYGIMPVDWARVKAYVGCETDDVEGIKGVGDKTAVKWIKNELNKKSKIWAKIKREVGTFERNLPLVKLPYPGTNTFELVDDEVTTEKWTEVAEMLGMKTLTRMKRKGFLDANFSS